MSVLGLKHHFLGTEKARNRIHKLDQKAFMKRRRNTMAMIWYENGLDNSSLFLILTDEGGRQGDLDVSRGQWGAVVFYLEHHSPGRMRQLRFAMVCASNQNRSMEAHAMLKKHGMNVSSFGVGAHVKLPGPSQKEPNVYKFGTPYKTIYDDLRAKDPELYTRNGLLQMLLRNLGVKLAPERYQENRDQFDVVVTFEERVMEQVLEDMSHRPQVSLQPVLICNMDVKDNHEEAAHAATQTLKLCQMLEQGGEWEDCVDAVVAQFQQETGRRLTYTICYY